jgi:hypothetical protein
MPGNWTESEQPRVDELLGRARDRLSRYDDDRDVRRASDHVDRAVAVGGRWIAHPVRYRTAPEENVLAIETPRGATEIAFSLDHGKGATVEAFLG